MTMMSNRNSIFSKSGKTLCHYATRVTAITGNEQDDNESIIFDRGSREVIFSLPIHNSVVRRTTEGLKIHI